MSGKEKKRGAVEGSKDTETEISRSSDLVQEQGNKSSSGHDDAKNRPNIDKSGLYDLQQVKRLLDDEVILVSGRI